MKSTFPRLYWQDWFILLLLWFAASMVDLSWLILDQHPPAWDQGAHLTRALHHWAVLRQPDWGSPDWWQSLWKLSPGDQGPVLYLLTAPLLRVLGRGFDQVTLLNSGLTVPLLALVYLLGRHLFDRRTGLLAATICLFIPSFVLLRTDYLPDYGLTVLVLAAFMGLTGWRDASQPISRWLWATGLGLALGLTLLCQLTGVLFFIIPMLWVMLVALWQRQPWRLGQLTLAAVIALGVVFPWVQANWLTMLTPISQSSVTGMATGGIAVNDGSGWINYARSLPTLLPWPLLYIPLAAWGVWGIVDGLGRRWQWPYQGIVARLANRIIPIQVRSQSWFWLLGLIAASYGLLSLLQPDDPRHILPCIPLVMIALVRGITLWRRPWSVVLALGMLTLMTVLTLASLFPLPLIKAPYQHRPYLGTAWPHRDVIAAVIAEDPYVHSTLGVLPNTATVNPMNLDFYGALKDFRVTGREIGVHPEFVAGDQESLNWYVTQTGDSESQHRPDEAKAALQQQLAQDAKLAVKQTWSLPDGSELRLLQRKIRPVRVFPLGYPLETVNLEAVDIRSSASPGAVVPINYRLTGPWQSLQSGLLLVTWEAIDSRFQPGWIHDHGIGLGQLYAGLTPPEATAGFKVEERLTMVIPPQTGAGRYRLKVTYLNRLTGETQALSVPEKILTVTPTAPMVKAKYLDLVSQFRYLALGLETGDLDSIFQEIGRMNQYDPQQDYLKQTEQALSTRLQQTPSRLDWLYGLLLSQVLQHNAAAGLETVNKITEIAPDNPYHWAYASGLHLYQFEPRQADQALNRAAQLNPELPQLKPLQAINAFMHLNLLKGFTLLKDT
jgi:4-amino-4-deoxy-L-arabinose transferase-like glycosyltransferase